MPRRFTWKSQASLHWTEVKRHHHLVKKKKKKQCVAINQYSCRGHSEVYLRHRDKEEHELKHIYNMNIQVRLNWKKRVREVSVLMGWLAVLVSQDMGLGVINQGDFWINPNSHPDPRWVTEVTIQESKEIFLWRSCANYPERGLGAGFHAVYLRDGMKKAELSDSCFAFVLSGKKNDLQAKKHKLKIG